MAVLEPWVTLSQKHSSVILSAKRNKERLKSRLKKRSVYSRERVTCYNIFHFHPFELNTTSFFFLFSIY